MGVRQIELVSLIISSWWLNCFTHIYLGVMGWNYTPDLYNLINIQVKINMLFKMLLDTFLPGLMSERPQVLKSNTDRIYLLGYPVSCENEGLCLTECFLEFSPLLEVTGNKVHLEQDVNSLIFIEVFCQRPANLYWIFPTRSRIVTLFTWQGSHSAAGNSAGMLISKKVKHAPTGMWETAYI